ncbi:replication factor A2 [Nematocida minor]|uniref:replication factor A2 n=1 Tax=Nematocida minor TaxID=1912983 RepID=UPI0022203E16|nr:replication factor A2 [Nematocida minor]XP_051332107.1 replication factor A2 [Nematocida minor]KAI5188837.1 replication factor A2 [Nematocida minor]KAI5188941.1 replication factor A2 [Nematocida minor]
MNSLPTSDSRGSKSIKRMAIKHIKQAELSDEIKQNAQFRGIDISVVELMGWVVSVKDLPSNGKKFVLNDGTETISCTMWSNKKMEYLKPGAFIKALGSLGRHNQNENEVVFSCTAVLPVLDGNNMVYHLLMRIVDSMKAEKEDAAYKTKSSTLENVPAKSQNAPGHMGDFEQIHLDILSYFSQNQGGTGLSIAMVTNTLASTGYYSKIDISEGLEYLIDAGKLFYCTEDRKMLAHVE